MSNTPLQDKDGKDTLKPEEMFCLALLNFNKHMQEEIKAYLHENKYDTSTQDYGRLLMLCSGQNMIYALFDLLSQHKDKLPFELPPGHAESVAANKILLEAAMAHVQAYWEFFKKYSKDKRS